MASTVSMKNRHLPTFSYFNQLTELYIAYLSDCRYIIAAVAYKLGI